MRPIGIQIFAITQSDRKVLYISDVSHFGPITVIQKVSGHLLPIFFHSRSGMHLPLHRPGVQFYS